MKSDFIPAAELAQLTGRKLKTLYNEHSTGRGPLAPILTKFGMRLGAWRADYEAFVASQRKFRDQSAA
jgi:predicted DNA-binding transcriptional regulator AlpA